MKTLKKIQDDTIRKYCGIKDGYISQESRIKARKNRKKKRKK